MAGNARKPGIGRTSGPPPVPNEVARKRGNPGKRTLDKNPPTVHPLSSSGEVPVPPSPLGERGIALWGLAWREAKAWLSITDQQALLLLCQDIDEREQLRATVMSEGDWRQRSQLRALDKQIVDKLQLLGFTPADRTRLGVGEVKEVDELEAFRSEVG